MKVRFLFAWYDAWIGAYWDRQNRRLYVLPIPFFGVVLDFGKPDPAVEEARALAAASWEKIGEEAEDSGPNEALKELMQTPSTIEFQRLMSELAHDPEAASWVAETVGVSRPTVMRWAAGDARPFPAMRRSIFRRLKEAGLIMHDDGEWEGDACGDTQRWTR